MFENLQPAPPDPILGLTEAFKADPNPKKVNLGVGVYKDAQGRTPVLDCVKAAEKRILDTEQTKSYKPIDGDPDYTAKVQRLMLGDGHPLLEAGRLITAHAPSGTGALRVAGDYLKQQHPSTTVWLSEPTWANHPKVFGAAGLPTRTYPYANADATGLAFDQMLEGLRQIPAGDVVVLHGCCHNPSGIDPTDEQWHRIAALLADRRVVPLLDFAYQGFGDGLREDASGLLALLDACPEAIVCTSFSKNMSLYNERVGSVSFLAEQREHAQAVLSHLKVTIRTNYSNPPAHGGEIVRTVLGDEQLTRQWLDELKQMRDRINTMRALFVDKLADRGVQRDFSFLKEQRGMFSFSGLTKDQVQTLKEQYAIYIVGSGRINVAGLTQDNIDYVCNAVAEVL